jgi:putative addiction module component (TIGR02574 family)
MTANTERILKEALHLPPDERAQLAESLFSSLKISEENLDRMWAKEADSRIDAYERGELRAIPAEKVFEKLFIEEKTAE